MGQKSPPPRTQHTPKGTEIPVPKRRDFMQDLEKIARPKPDAEQEPPKA